MNFKAVFVILLATTACKAELRLNCQYMPNELVMVKAAPAQDPCLNEGTKIVALTSSRVLYTCVDSKTVWPLRHLDWPRWNQQTKTRRS